MKSKIEVLYEALYELIKETAGIHHNTKLSKQKEKEYTFEELYNERQTPTKNGHSMSPKKNDGLGNDETNNITKRLKDQTFKNSLMDLDKVNWKEVFLLDVEPSLIQKYIGDQLTSKEIMAAKFVFHKFFEICIKHFENPVKVVKYNAIVTLKSFFIVIFKKNWPNFSVSIMSVVCPFQNADSFFEKIIVHLKFINKHEPLPSIRYESLLLLKNLLTGTSNINENALIDYFSLRNVFDMLIEYGISCKTKFSYETLKPEYRSLLKLHYHNDVDIYEIYSRDIRTLSIECLILLANYRKYETKNKYIEQLATTRSKDFLNSVNEALIDTFRDFNIAFTRQVYEQQPNVVSSFVVGFLPTNIGSLFHPQIYDKVENLTEETDPWDNENRIRKLSFVLLLFYEMVHTNKYFATSLCNSLAKKGDGRFVADAMIEFIKMTSILYQSTIFTTKHSNLLHLSMIIYLTLIEKKAFKKYIFEETVQLNQVEYFERVSEEPCLFRHKSIADSSSLGNGGAMANIIYRIMAFYCQRVTISNRIDMRAYTKASSVIHNLFMYAASFNQRLKSIRFQPLWETHTSMVQTVVNRLDNLPVSQTPHVIKLLIQLLSTFNLFLLCGDRLVTSEYDYHLMIAYLVKTRTHFVKMKKWILKQQHKTLKLLFDNLDHVFDATDHLSSSLSPPNLAANIATIKISLKRIANIDKFAMLYMENPNHAPFFMELIRQSMKL